MGIRPASGMQTCVVLTRQASRGKEDTLHDVLQEWCMLTSQARAWAGTRSERSMEWTGGDARRCGPGKKRHEVQLRSYDQ